MRSVYFAKFLKEKCKCDLCTEQQKQDRGCYGNGKIAYQDVDGEMIYTCPGALLKDSNDINYEMAMIYNNYNEHGLLPYAGGIYEMPAVIIDAINTIDYQLTQEQYV